MHVVATAGHVDHGKSTLVRALTGHEPDRLAEERRRGLSIELGYVWTELPGVGDVAFVDVPGHERFIATTLSGVGPVPVAMLVVAADDPWMPQAQEHLAALDSLGVSHGVLVVTRSDLADPAPALARARQHLVGTSMAAVPAVTVSGHTGAGLDELRSLLAGILRDLPVPPPDADVRLWVDRRFHVRGAGTVVTGTLPAGTVRVGDLLTLGDQEVRVRGLECLGKTVTEVSGVARVALDLGGRAPGALHRGSALVTPDAFEPTTTVDVRVRGSSRLPERPMLHVGAAMVGVRARPIGEDHARLTLDEPLPLRIGDRAILRDPGSRSLWGVRVLDPAPPALARRGAAALRAKELTGCDGSLAEELTRRGVVRRSLLRRIGAADDSAPPGTITAGDWVLSPGRADALRGRLEELVRPSSDSRLGDTGLAPAAAANALDLPDPALVLALVTAPLRLERGRIVHESSAMTTLTQLPPAVRASLDALHADLAEAPFAAPDAARLVEIGLDARTVATLHRAGLVLRLADSVVLLPGADEAAVALLRTLPQPFTASEARTALGTTRRVALPLLSLLDRTGQTVRLADDRRRLREIADS